MENLVENFRELSRIRGELCANFSRTLANLPENFRVFAANLLRTFANSREPWRIHTYLRMDLAIRPLGTRRRAGNRLPAAVWCVFVLWLVLCAIMGAQHFNPHIRVLVAARVPNVRVATAVRARESSLRVAWRPGRRARAGRGAKRSASHGKGGKLFDTRSMSIYTHPYRTTYCHVLTIGTSTW